MAWTPPRTWSPGEFVTALMMNTHVRDNLLLLKTSISDDGTVWSGLVKTTNVGPHAFGSATETFTAFLLAGTFTPSAGAFGFRTNYTINVPLNESGYITAFGGTLVEAASGTHTMFATLRLSPPSITAGSAVLTNAAALYITGTPSAATNNYAILVDAGVVGVPLLRVQNSAASYWQFDRNDSTGNLELADSNSTAKVSVTSAGWMGIGADSQISLPSYALHVRSSRATWGTFVQNDHATPYGLFVHYSTASPNTGDNAFINCADASTVRMRVMSNGGVHNYTANDANLSDADTKIFEPGRPNRRTHLDKICQIEFKMGKYKDSTRERPDLMWTAQQLALIDEDWVVTWQKEERDGAGVITRPKLLGTRDHVVFMTNVFATQELQAQYVRLDQAVADHEVRIKKLENKAA